MALIQCTECGNQVSDKAACCPKCGSPVANASTAHATGSPVTTTESTSKQMKGHQAAAVCAIILGLFMAISSGEGSRQAALGAAIGLAGVIWYLVARVRSWWHHG